ncbi:hypothetical protein ACFL2J_07900 [Candidatus Omnitrophota bacterium]
MIRFLLLFLSITSSAFADDIKDIKPPVYFPRDYLILIIILAAVIAAGLFFWLRSLLNKRKKERPKFTPPPKPADQLAYEALRALQVKNLPAAGKIKEYYIELSDIVRRYIENRFNIRAPEMTTEEFLFSLRDCVALTDVHKNLLKDFLEQCDMVKFARYGPTLEEIDNSFKAAWRFVDETKPVVVEPEKK